jgi:vacuolar protein sorting-associated protein 16
MIGPYGDWLRFPYEGVENLYIIPEIDCCRIVTDTAVEILQRVPPATALLLRIGSIETSAMLLDAADSFYSNSPSSDDEAARNIIKSGMLYDAIETCTDSAMKEYDIHTQKRLLRAASYGMHFTYKAAMNTITDNSTGMSSGRIVLGGPVTGSVQESGILPSETTVRFVDAARKLRTLNALRNPNVGFIVTSNQYDTMTPTGIVARLIAMKRPALASAISQYLNLPSSVQLFARASKAIAVVEIDKHRSDSEVADSAIRIINNISPSPMLGGGTDIDNNNRGQRPSSVTTITSNASCRGAYAMVAIAAQRAGRPGVAKILLQLESSVPDKVPALVSTGAFAEAIAVATSARYVSCC